MELRVFLVEDIHNLRRLMNELAEALGNLRIVGSAVTEAEANLWLDEHPGAWDIAVVDLVLEQGSGIGVLARAHSQGEAGKIVIFSGYASAGIKAHCLALGAAAVFDKARPEEFITWLANESVRLRDGRSPAA